MKTLFTGLAFIFATLLVLLMGLDKLYEKLLLSNQNLKATYVTQHSLENDLLFSGPCEPYWMIDPVQMDPLLGTQSYNLALDHSDFADNLLHLHLYLQNNKAPKTVLLYATPESFDLRFNVFHSYRFAPYLSDSLVQETVAASDPDYFRFSSIPFLRFAYYNRFTNFKVVQGFKHWLQGKASPTYPSGYISPSFGSGLGSLDGQIPDDKSEHFVWNEKREVDCRAFIEYAQSNEIQVILYESPIYVKATDRQDNRDQCLGRINKIAEDFAIPYWIFEEPEFAKDPSNFLRKMNTSVKGSKKFNKLLAKRLQSELDK